MENFKHAFESSIISRDGNFKDYFGDTIKVGDIVVFIATEFRDTKDFYKAEVKSLVTNKSGEDYCIVKILNKPYDLAKIKDGSKKRCDLCVIVNNG